MIETLWVTNPSGNTLTLDMRRSSELFGLLVFSITGLGPPKATINSLGGPSVDGVKVNSIKADARHLVLTLVVTKGGQFEEQAKQLIYDYFPIKENIILRIKTSLKDVYIPAIVEQNEFNQFALTENAVISLYCPKPYFIDMEERSESIGADFGIPLFEFPFENNSLVSDLLEFGYITDLPTAYIAYGGEIETGMDINMVFTGFAEDIVITNTNRSQQMTLDFDDVEAYFGLSVKAGDQVFINTRVGEKSIFFVRDGVWFNMINGVGIDDDWIQLFSGSNTIIINATTGIDQIDTELIFRELKAGV